MTATAGVAASPPRGDFKDHLRRTGRALRAYRPRWHDRRFWILQILTISLVGLHNGIDFGWIHSGLNELYFLPVSLLLVPVVFAALTYGFVGAVATTLWVAALNIPDVIMAHLGLERIGVLSELLLLAGIACVIGVQVDRERRLQRHTEDTAAALKASTMMYQGLLETNPIAVMVVSPGGGILEANPAANVLFGKSKTDLERMKLSDLFGAESVQQLLGMPQDSRGPVRTLTLNSGGRELFFEPRMTQSSDGKGNPVIQVLLRDVTEEFQRREGLRAYAAEVLRALEEERQLIARELHDETIQILILLCNQLDDAEDMAAPLSPTMLSKLKDARKSTEQIVKELRDFAKALRPPILDDLGLIASIRRLQADFTDRAKIEGQVVISGTERRLPSNVELGIYRITQEALRNVERHAGAKFASVIVTFTEHGAMLDVVDDGSGFAVPSASGDFTASGQLGLISMQERAQLLGGKLEIQSRPGKGTRVTVSITDTEKALPAPSRRLDL